MELPAAEYEALRERIRGELALRLAPGGVQEGGRELAARIEHTCLRPEATRNEIEQLCAEAKRYEMGGVCVAPAWLALAVSALRDSPVRVAAVVGFPHGDTLATVKRQEAAECLKLGADDLDMVIALGAATSGNWTVVGDEVSAVAELAHAAGARVKAIVECGRLTPERAAEAARVCAAAGADFIKTATGFGPRAVTEADVRQLRAAAPAGVGIKAAGGIRTRAQAEALVRAGADRIGSSAGVALVTG